MAGVQKDRMKAPYVAVIKQLYVISQMDTKTFIKLYLYFLLAILTIMAMPIVMFFVGFFLIPSIESFMGQYF